MTKTPSSLDEILTTHVTGHVVGDGQVFFSLDEAKAQIQAYIANELREVIGEDDELTANHRALDEFGEETYCGCVVCDRYFHENKLRAEQRARALNRGYDINPKSESEE